MVDSPANHITSPGALYVVIGEEPIVSAIINITHFGNEYFSSHTSTTQGHNIKLKKKKKKKEETKRDDEYSIVQDYE